jgi:hypothetical protein
VPPLTVVHESVEESTELDSLVRQHLHGGVNSRGEAGASALQHRLSAYSDAAADGLSGDFAVLLQHPFSVAGKAVYHAVLAGASLRGALEGRTLIEFPTFTVVPREAVDAFITH